MYIEDLHAYQKIRGLFFDHAAKCSICGLAVKQNKLGPFCQEGDFLLDQATHLVMFAKMLGAPHKPNLS